MRPLTLIDVLQSLNDGATQDISQTDNEVNNILITILGGESTTFADTERAAMDTGVTPGVSSDAMTCQSFLGSCRFFGKMIPLRADYRSTIHGDLPVGYWRMSERTGFIAWDASGNNGVGTLKPLPTVADASGNSKTGALALGTANMGITLGVHGASNDGNRATHFDGDSGGYITTPLTTNPGLTNMTVEAFLQAAYIDTNSHVAIQQLDGTGTGRDWLGITSSGLIYTNVGGAALTTTRAVATGGMYSHVAVTLSGSTLTVYVNGIQAAQNPAVTPEFASGAWVIGSGKTPPASLWAGTIDEVAIYPTALSAARVYAHWVATTTNTYSAAVLADSPAGYWRLSDGN